MSQEPNACDDWGNPMKLSVSDGFEATEPTLESIFADQEAQIADLKSQVKNQLIEILELRKARDEWIEIANKETARIAELHRDIIGDHEFAVRKIAEKDARIAELEAALIKERATIIHHNIYGRFSALYIDAWIPAAKEQLRCEGLLQEEP